MTAEATSPADVLHTAAGAAGIESSGATLIRDGSNVLYRLPGNRVARIGPPCSHAHAAREVAVSYWLTGIGFPVVRALDDVPQPTMIGDRPVTWWEYIRDPRHGTTDELATLLRRLHDRAAPDSLDLPEHDPFAGLDERIASAEHIDAEDRDWLGQRLSQLRDEYRRLRPGQARSVIHGDAWQGNVVVPTGGNPVMLDLEHVAYGDPDWDLIPIAVDRTDFARLATDDYRAFVTAYGDHDVTTTPKFRILADIQELRWVCFVLGKAAVSPVAAHETRHRVACLRGDIPRPWTWTAF